MKGIKIPGRLYGREKEIEALFNSFENISKGGGEVLTVPGHSGVGKSSLVQKLQQPVKEGNGIFAQGKFEQYQQNIPYFAFSQAFVQIYDKLQAESEELRKRYCKEINDALGDLGQVLIELVPQFEELIGKQSPLGLISPQEARHRFTQVIQNFLIVMSKPEHPLVLFIDDWQWADSASLDLLKQLKIGETVRYLLVVVAYRDNELGNGHLLPATLAELKVKNVPLKEIKIENISISNIEHLLSDTLLPEVNSIQNLAGMVHEKTAGNPFFINSLINYLAESDMLWFDDSLTQWQWESSENASKAVADSVVQLFIDKFMLFNDTERNVISMASCLGNRFSANILAKVTGLKYEQCKNLLLSSPLNNIISPIYNYPNDKSQVIADTFVFKHDRLQQAAFSLINYETLPALLLEIGRILLVELNKEKVNEHLFEIVNNLNYGRQLITEKKELTELLRLNVLAGRKAYTAIAYQQALKYYRAAEKTLENKPFRDEMWATAHDFMMEVYKEHAQCEFLEGDLNKGERYLNVAMGHAGSAAEKADVYNILILQYTLLSRYTEAIETGRVALKSLGIHLPNENYEEARDKEIAKVQNYLACSSVASLASLKMMTDTDMLVASRILITMGPPCYRSHQKLWSVIVPIVVKLTLKYGNIPQLGYSHTAFGGLLAWVNDDYQTAKEFGDLATTLMSKEFNSPSDQSVFYLMIGSSIRHWFKHLKFGSQDYIDAYNIGLRSGNLQYAAYAFGHNMYCQFYQGKELSNLIKDTQRSLEFSKTRYNQWAIDLFNGGIQIMESITSPTNKGLDEDIENKYLQEVTRHQNIQVICIYKVLKTTALIIKGDFARAFVVNQETEPIIYTVGTQGLLPWAEYVFARFVIMAGLYQNESEPTRQLWYTELKKIQQKLKKWALYCPENFLHKYLMACAEIARIDQNYTSAFELYEAAIESAREGDFIQWEAFFNERAYQLWHKYNNDHLAFQYWKQAYICYRHWGAVAKIKQMEEDYMLYLIDRLPPEMTPSEIRHNNKDITKWLIENQLKYLERFSQQSLESKYSKEALNKADELAMATKRLRTEIAIRKEVEEKVKQQNKELQKINAEKDKFFSIIAHDLKSPFSGILGLSKMLVQKVKNKEFNDIEKHAEIIRESSNKALELLKNLMEWSKSQTGRIVFTPTRFDLVTLIHEMQKLYTNIAGEKQIKLRKVIPDQLFIHADKPMISTIFRNLLSNAIKFTHEGGEIVVTAYLQDDAVKIGVTDNGVGIPEHVRHKLFKLTENYSTPGTADEVGTGLGLVLCKEFIDKHKGKIWVESEEGKGSTFYFELPLENKLPYEL